MIKKIIIERSKDGKKKDILLIQTPNLGLMYKTDIKLLYIKQIINKDLLYSTGNSTQYSIITNVGKE